jgi:hypothetical protein
MAVQPGTQPDFHSWPTLSQPRIALAGGEIGRTDADIHGRNTMTVEAKEQIEATLAHHLKALGDGDVEAILSDYTENSVVFSPDGPVRGLDQLRAMFTGTLANIPNFMEGFHILRQECEGDIAYLVWKKDKVFPLGTDTMVIRDGKILVQTFAAYSPPLLETQR